MKIRKLGGRAFEDLVIIRSSLDDEAGVPMNIAESHQLCGWSRVTIYALLLTKSFIGSSFVYSVYDSK
jgi:hypothetical protein